MIMSAIVPITSSALYKEHKIEMNHYLFTYNITVRSGYQAVGMQQMHFNILNTLLSTSVVARSTYAYVNEWFNVNKYYNTMMLYNLSAKRYEQCKIIA
jgi:hypothetical protein